jgi:hypothetical protein
MPHILTETATYDAVVTVPDDSDPRTAASVITALQALANRSKWAHDKLVAGDVQVHRYASLSAMAGVQPADGTVAVIAGSNASENVYIFDASSSAAALSIYVVVPTGAPTTGRWILASVPILFNAGHDGASARLYTPPANGNVLPSDADPGRVFITAPTFAAMSGSASWNLVTDGGSHPWVTPTLALLNGDIIEVTADFSVDKDTSAVIKACIGVNGAPATDTLKQSELVGIAPMGLRLRLPISATDNYIFGVYAYGQTSSSSKFWTPCGLTWKVWRP